ncbi:MAG: DUF2752 domain-containing protein [Acidobacteriota bacterium]
MSHAPSNSGELAPAGRQLAVLWAGAVLCLVALSPFGSAIAGFMGACPFKETTGVPCPSCGTSRAAMGLARLDVWGAFSAYPLPTLGWTFFVLGGLWAGAWTALGRDLPSLPRRLPRWALILVVAAMLGNWAYSIATGV